MYPLDTISQDSKSEVGQIRDRGMAEATKISLHQQGQDCRLIWAVYRAEEAPKGCKREVSFWELREVAQDG